MFSWYISNLYVREKSYYLLNIYYRLIMVLDVNLY